MSEEIKTIPEPVLTRYQIYYRKNRNKCIAKVQKYYAENAEDISRKSKKRKSENKDSIRKQRKEYADKNRELLNEKQRQYAAANREKVRASRRNSYYKNREKTLSALKQKRIEEPEECRKYSRKYYAWNASRLCENARLWAQKNRHKIRVRERKYVENNRGKVYAKIARRKALKISQLHPNANQSKISEIYKESKAMSVKTGIVHAVDHIIPLAYRGWHHEENLQILTKRLNSRKSDKPFWLSRTLNHKDWRDVPRELWPVDLVPKYDELIEKHKDKSFRWACAAA